VRNLQRIRRPGPGGSTTFAVVGDQGAVELVVHPAHSSVRPDATIDGQDVTALAIDYHAVREIRDGAGRQPDCEWTGGDCYGWGSFRGAATLLQEWSAGGGGGEEHLFYALELEYVGELEHPTGAPQV
jgi:hypothetical protein